MTLRVLRLPFLLSLPALLTLAANDKKPALPAYVLSAQTAIVIIDPNAGTSPSDPLANQKARDEVEKALMKWGRFRLVMDMQSADLIIVVRKGSGKVVQPTIGGLPTNDRPVIVQPTDTGIRLGGQKGQPPGGTQTSPQDTGPGPQVEMGQPDDMFTVYHAAGAGSLDQSPAWRYIKKDALKSPAVPAVDEFRKAIETAEKQQRQQKSKP